MNVHINERVDFDVFFWVWVLGFAILTIFLPFVQYVTYQDYGIDIGISAFYSSVKFFGFIIIMGIISLLPPFLIVIYDNHTRRL